MSERGFIALARGMLDHPIVGVPPRTPYSRSEAWQWLLFEAAYKPRRYDAGGIVCKLERGQIAHSVRYMAKAWRWSAGTVQRLLERLKSDTMIDTATDTGVTVITICRYNEYQTPPTATDTPTDTDSDTRAIQERYRKEQGNNSKKDNTPSGEPLGFSDWYAIYPKKKKPRDAARAFAAAMKRGDISMVALMDRTRAHAAFWTAQPPEKRQFCPYPASWLNGGGYFDEPEGPGSGGNGFKVTRPTRTADTFTEAEWCERVESFKSASEWSSLWGPRPGDPGCLVPAHLLEPA